MPNVSIARRYARALIEVASESKSTDAVGMQLDQLARWAEGSPELLDVFSNPAYSRAQRMAVVEKLLGQLGTAEPALVNVLKLMVDRHRLNSLTDMARIYKDMADARAGRVRGRITSAVALPDEAVRKVEQALQKLTQRDVVLDSKVDPAVLGGASAQVGSFLYDGTVKSQLEELRRTLKRG
jgi:F-type H+-transporting ATPase subunit delta